jgi:hypothetical protein
MKGQHVDADTEGLHWGVSNSWQPVRMTPDGMRSFRAVSQRLPLSTGGGFTESERYDDEVRRDERGKQLIPDWA